MLNVFKGGSSSGNSLGVKSVNLVRKSLGIEGVSSVLGISKISLVISVYTTPIPLIYKIFFLVQNVEVRWFQL